MQSPSMCDWLDGCRIFGAGPVSRKQSLGIALG